MADLTYPSRSARVLIRLRPDELERATVLAKCEEVKLPELLRRLLAREWRASTAADHGEGVCTEQT
jgi:hypothetical protein